MKKLRWALLATLGLAVLLGYAAPVGAHDGDTALSTEVRSLLDEVRGATARYSDLPTAEEAGYGKFLDCFTMGDEMGMGQHYVNGELVGDDVLDPLQPEALVYEPREDGSMILVAFEYLVFADVWDPGSTGSAAPTLFGLGQDFHLKLPTYSPRVARRAPTLFGQDFHLKTNIPGTPPVWALHLWLWTHNPEGLFADYNPTVSCPADQPVIDMSQS